MRKLKKLSTVVYIYQQKKVPNCYFHHIVLSLSVTFFSIHFLYYFKVAQPTVSIHLLGTRCTYISNLS